MNNDVEISRPFDIRHCVSISVNKSTGKIEGIPPHVFDAIEKAGFKEEQYKENPMILSDLLQTIPLNPVLEISSPIVSSFSHNISIKFNKEEGKFEGVPDEVRQAILNAGLKEEDVMRNPELARDIIYKISLCDVLKYGTASEISKPYSSCHRVAITFNPQNGKFEGIPEPILKLLAEKGLTVEQCVKDPSLASFLYDLDEDILKEVAPIIEISKPTDIAHVFSVTVNKETGKLEGIPDAIRKAFEEAGITEEQVIKNPDLATPVLSKLTFNDVLNKDAIKNISSPTNVAHKLSITFNKHTGKFEGIPDNVLKFITERGLTVEQIVADVKLADYILEQVEKAELLNDVPNIIDVSNPIQSFHNLSITMNKETGKLEGIPDAVREAFANAGLTEEQVMKDPSLAAGILEKFTLDDFKPKLDVSAPISATHNISIKFNPETGKFEGIPEEVRRAVLESGLTEEQVMKNPHLAMDILYKLSLEDVLKGIKK